MTMETIARENFAYFEAELARRRAHPPAVNDAAHAAVHAELIQQSERDLAYWRGWVATYDYKRMDPSSAELRAELGARWAICRPTPANLARHGNCVTPKAYNDAVDRILRKRHEGKRP